MLIAVIICAVGLGLLIIGMLLKCCGYVAKANGSYIFGGIIEFIVVIKKSVVF